MPYIPAAEDTAPVFLLKSEGVGGLYSGGLPDCPEIEPVFFPKSGAGLDGSVIPEPESLARLLRPAPLPLSMLARDSSSATLLLLELSLPRLLMRFMNLLWKLPFFSCLATMEGSLPEALVRTERMELVGEGGISKPSRSWSASDVSPDISVMPSSATSPNWVQVTLNFK
eukprot:CAMPEP_0202413062 /NCGR_PEP_ID=MMETSP1128-20130828/28036_1 /ASSEMBLY_ACC=CAM_ASM_000463 /TAXON_ID=3047 /ORGANISM="Dunaliella tertiolecta, Strain CCMP1320" /LENGTH=169 /DNA_ID=CAMNT_0049019127 /DNA_START=114 /DNA_END=623 /DNA_ORIENTATION=+